MIEPSSEDAIEEFAAEQTVSERLVEARESLGLSQKDVADQLFLTSTFIRYLDEAQFDKIPKPAFIKGYMRSYARVVNLKGDEIVAHYERGLQKAEHKVEVRGVTEERIGSATITGPVLQTGIVGLVAIVLVIALVWIFSSSDDEEAANLLQDTPLLQDTIDEVSTDAGDTVSNISAREVTQAQLLSESISGTSIPGEALGDEVLAMAANEAGSEGHVADIEGIEGEGSESFEGVEDNDGSTSAPTDDAEAAQSAAPVAASQQETASDRKDITIESTRSDNYQYINVDAGGFEQLEFSFTGECWLEIEDGDGQSIYGDLNRSGDILTLYGVAPFKILLGRASGVSLKFNREDVDLAEYTSRDQTAKLNLGG